VQFCFLFRAQGGGGKNKTSLWPGRKKGTTKKGGKNSAKIHWTDAGLKGKGGGEREKTPIGDLALKKKKKRRKKRRKTAVTAREEGRRTVTLSGDMPKSTSFITGRRKRVTTIPPVVGGGGGGEEEPGKEPLFRAEEGGRGKSFG